MTEDHYTHTEADAAAWERAHADHDDDQPTLAELLQDARLEALDHVELDVEPMPATPDPWQQLVSTCDHVWSYRASMGDPYRTCRMCGDVEDVDL